MDNKDKMIYYNQLRTVPQEAKKPIGGGRLKGMTDISPMWRIKRMTEIFGPVGIGWYYTIEKQWLEAGAGEEQKAFCNINLYYKQENEWSMPIPGTGGSDFVVKESKGLYTSDECFKMALTDALSVAMKALGIAADVYFEKDRSKYDNHEDGEDKNQKMMQDVGKAKIDAPKVKTLLQLIEETGTTREAIEDFSKCKLEDMTYSQWGTIIATLEKRKQKGA